MGQPTDPHAPYRLYKSDISYFSGKVEAFFRYKQIPHTPVDTDLQTLRYIGEHTGTMKMPAAEGSDGTWLYDSTPMLQWLDQYYSAASIYPDNPALRFVALLIEDYADEWLWRPAMWWRWMPTASNHAVGWRIAAEFLSPYLATPLGKLFGERQKQEWLRGDGMTKENEQQIRDLYLLELETLEAQLQLQPYLLGSHPSIVDFGYFASMFRHFGNDPEPAEVMRRKAPHVYEWLARLWNCDAAKLSTDINWFWPEQTHWQPLLKRIWGDYLPYLQQNAQAHHQKRKRFDFYGHSIAFPKTKTTHYRVWCLERLQQEFEALTLENQNKVAALFSGIGDIKTALFENGDVTSGIADQYQLPIYAQDSESKKPTLFRALLGQPRN